MKNAPYTVESFEKLDGHGRASCGALDASITTKE